MKILFCLLLLLFAYGGAHAGFVTVRAGAGSIAIDSPAARPAPRWNGRHLITPTRQVAGYGILSLTCGLLSMAGAVALVVLWPVTVGVGIALGVGALAAGIAAIIFADLDSMNIRPHPVLSLTGGILGFIAILPVVFPVSICVSIYALFAYWIKNGKKRRKARRAAQHGNTSAAIN